MDPAGPRTFWKFKRKLAEENAGGQRRSGSFGLFVVDRVTAPD